MVILTISKYKQKSRAWLHSVGRCPCSTGWRHLVPDGSRGGWVSQRSTGLQDPHTHSLLVSIQLQDNSLDPSPDNSRAKNSIS